MEEVRQLVQEEGREARNLVAFHVAVDSPARISRKPPRSLPPRRIAPRPARLRSASAGRDKRSELRARYWALLFGDLQRAIGEIYNTVEAHENLNECQEVILVLENYTRDFKALGEWFRLKWEYDNTPPPQRPQSLAWEIRKTDFVRPESRRTHSVKSSPSVSGKNSPCFSGHNTPSGKNSPNLTGKVSPGSGKISPRISSGHSSTSPKGNIEFFSNKIAGKTATSPEPKNKDARLSDITEKDVKENNESDLQTDKIKNDDEIGKLTVVETGKAKVCPNVTPNHVVVKAAKVKKVNLKNQGTNVSNAAKVTTQKLDEMENEFLAKQITENQAKNDNLINQDKDKDNKENNAHNNSIAEKISDKDISEKVSEATESPTKSEDNFGDVSNASTPNTTDEKTSDTSANIEETVILKADSDILETPKFETKLIDNPKDIVSSPEKKLMDTEDNKKDSIKLNYQNLSKNVESVPKGTDIDKSLEKTQKADMPLKDNKNEKKDQEFKKPEPKPRPAYSQAAAKPKTVIAVKTEVKTPVKTTPLARSKTVVEIRPNSTPKPQRPFTKRNQANKCSYPFNLTTGRTSLFDSTPIAKVVPKKPIGKNAQMSAGDAKSNQKNPEPINRPPRPVSLKINDNGDQIENNPQLKNIKDYEEYGSTDSVTTQIDVSRIESCESLKTLVPDEYQCNPDVTNSIEVLNVDGNKNDNDGWLTVKSRRLSRESKKQSKSHWANRFHQPSATTSLPTLSMLESPKQETNPTIESAKSKQDRAKSEQPEKIEEKTNKKEALDLKEDILDKKAEITEKKEDKSDKVLKSPGKGKSESKANKDPAIIRQKSDVTGLKTRPARNKTLSRKAEKAKGSRKDDDASDLTKNRLHSSLESLTTGLARSQESTEDAFDFDKWKAEFKSTFKYLEEDDQMQNHNEILMSADPSEMSEIAEMTSQIEENEKKISWALDFQSEVDQRKLCEEEDSLNRQIMELQQVSDIDLDTETDDTETDAEILCEDTNSAIPSTLGPRGPLAASLEDQYETALAGMSWAERMDTLVVLEELVARDPGRAQQLHAKLSQGIKRRGSLQDALRRLQMKQARAERQRTVLQTERAKKIHQLIARVQEVKVAKNQLIEEKRLRMERRLQKAAENRDQHIKDIVRKAHDEEEKLREIAFITSLQAQNRRSEVLEHYRASTTRLRRRRQDRIDKLEQKQAREAAVGARRQAIEEARKLHVATLLEKRKERDARVEEMKEIKRQERGDAAREKAEGVKSRLSALEAAAKLEADALRSRIRHKQDASQLRLASHLQAIRERATGPRLATTSESQDPCAKEIEELDRLEQERKERERQKAIKKKARKIRQKLVSDNANILFDNHLPNLENGVTNRVNKLLHQLRNIITPILEVYQDNNKPQKENKQTNGEENVTTNGENTVSKKKKKKTQEDKTEAIVDSIEEEARSDTASSVKVKEKQESTGGKKRNRRKREHNEEKPQLSKSNSVCSSVSDRSKASNKVDKKRKVDIDMTAFERLLNEFSRSLERSDNVRGPARVVESVPLYPRVAAIRLIGSLLGALADREELANMFTVKSLSVAVITLSVCSAGAGHAAVTCAAPAHAAALLAARPEINPRAEQRDCELVKQLCDFLSITLDAAQAACEDRGEGGLDDAAKRGLRSRALLLISYICLSGCFSRVEKHTNYVRESLQTLLTACAEMCQPSPYDTGTELAAATRTLRFALGRSLCGSRSEFCMLFERGAGMDSCWEFVRAARNVQLLKAAAQADWVLVQEAFGEGGWPLEFRAAVARLLSQHAPTDKVAPRKNSRGTNQRLDQSLSEAMVLDLITLVGFVIVNNPSLHETICSGWSVVPALCTLPASWFVSAPHVHALVPTLTVMADSPDVAAVMSQEMSLQLLEDYLETPDAQDVKLVQVIKAGRQARRENQGIN